MSPVWKTPEGARAMAALYRIVDKLPREEYAKIRDEMAEFAKLIGTYEAVSFTTYRRCLQGCLQGRVNPHISMG